VIDFRYHVISIVAVFLALTVGIVLGSSFLDQPLLSQLGKEATKLNEQTDVLRTQVRQLQRDEQYRDLFVSEVTPTLVRDRLDGQTILVVSMPGVADTLIGGTITVLRQAGADIAGQLRMQESYGDPRRDAQLGELVARLAPSSLSLPAGSPAQRAGTVIAAATMTKNATSGPRPTDAVLTGFADAGFVEVTRKPTRRATLAVLLAAPADTDADTTSSRNVAGIALARALNSAGRGAVLGGPRETAVVGGIIAALRADNKLSREFSSIDMADTPPGQAGLVFALVAEASGNFGHYGLTSATDGPVANVFSPINP